MRFPDYPQLSAHPYYQALWERLAYEMSRIPDADDLTILTVRHTYAKNVLERIVVLAHVFPEHHALIFEWQNAVESVVWKRRQEIIEKVIIAKGEA